MKKHFGAKTALHTQNVVNASEVLTKMVVESKEQLDLALSLIKTAG